ncbi:MAG TPA: MotA/TolQ/ExbB proton channel family protein, partial [Pirellulaceae bacterium]
SVTALERATHFVGLLCYVALAIVAAWGTYCLVLIWMRIGQRRFTSEEQQSQWLDHIAPLVRGGDYAAIEAEASRDVRAVPQLVGYAVSLRDLDLPQVKMLVAERFQREVLDDLDQRLSWVHTMIKSAPMLGLHGTVIGMMGAFGKLAVHENVRPDALAEDISLALITTAIGLTTAIPLIIGANSVNIRIHRFQEMVDAGLRSFFRAWEHAAQIPPSKSFR